MAEEIPQWALDRACDLAMAGAETTVLCLSTDSGPYLKAFARYIMQHEQPPVDPLLIEAREIVAKFYDGKEGSRHRAKLFRDGDYDNEPECVQALTALRRGIELSQVQA